MEALQMLKFSICQSHSLNFTQDLDWADELRNLEYDAESQKQYPEDIRSYARSLQEVL